MTIVTTDLPTPVGTVRIAVRRSASDGDEAVVACGFADHWDGITAAVRPRFDAEEWLEGTSPAGTTCSYADIARALGQPTATRAVGTANGRNPVSIVVPCHRVVRADGTLGGYGGGLDRKTWLLGHEGANLVVAGT